MFFKLTLLTLILRLFHHIRWAHWLIWAGIAATTTLYTSLSVFILTNCVPRKGQTWHYTTYYGTCTMAQERNSLVNGVFGLISDLYILAIPLWLLSHLILPNKRKLGVMGGFLTGVLTCGCSLGGIAARALSNLEDGTWSIVYVFGILELNIGLICACMPVVALPLKAIGASIAASWNSLRDYSRTRLLNRSNRKLEGIDEYNMTHNPSYQDAGHQLPQMVKGDGAITGLRSFMRRAYRSTAGADTQKTAPLPTTQQIKTPTLITADYPYDYHDQLKNIHLVDIGGGSNYVRSHPSPQPPMPAVLQRDKC
ncbi:hypothetical protein KVR01_011874 [Diaporthe batatas]|uniref:uncharacterized protein n=1 Tax=Diaporthe batatas TaxID=748121 RepID=UPI001D041B44|nr:uncharacterized protein KVR01_011874 [Diaporthe batatas]KAG8158113.1 hypothetical protein KVR01_011874 [Diaporthe batatas]